MTWLLLHSNNSLLFSSSSELVLCCLQDDFFEVFYRYVDNLTCAGRRSVRPGSAGSRSETPAPLWTWWALCCWDVSSPARASLTSRHTHKKQKPHNKTMRLVIGEATTLNPPRKASYLLLMRQEGHQGQRPPRLHTLHHGCRHINDVQRNIPAHLQQEHFGWVKKSHPSIIL